MPIRYRGNSVDRWQSAQEPASKSEYSLVIEARAGARMAREFALLPLRRALFCGRYGAKRNPSRFRAFDDSCRPMPRSKGR